MIVPILIVIPYWTGDRHEAFEVCKIVAGLQQSHVGAVAHVMLVCRQDCPMDQSMTRVISQKFNTFTYQSQSPLKGWPSGANGMFGSAMIHISNNFAKNYECVYWLEPDCVPICTNWFWDLVTEWRRKHPLAQIIGHRHDCNGDGTGDHITGCAIYHPNIARIFPELTKCDRTAWDYQHRARIVAMGGHTNLIQNWYKATKAHEGILDQANKGVVLIHGFKDASMRDLVKKKYNIA